MFILLKGKSYFSTVTKDKIKSNSPNPIMHVQSSFGSARSRINLSNQEPSGASDATCTSTAHDKLYAIIKRLERRLESLEKKQ